MRLILLPFAFIATISLAGCSDPDPELGYLDPYENANRQMHKFNKNVDKALIKPASQAYGAVFNDRDDKIIDNFVDNIGLPGRAVNYLLQGRIDSFLETSTRFLFNTTIGLGGIFDPSTNFGLPNRETDFGETLAVWGVKEGVYIELPFFGGRTERDAAGLIVDFVLDPLNAVIPIKERQRIRAVRGVEIIGDRHILGDVVDSLYESDDSYAAARQVLLQNRRFQLQGEIATSDLEDPFADE